MPNGEVMAIGGYTSGASTINSVEIYNPSTGLWTVANSLNAARGNPSTSVLPNGTLLVCGGDDGSTFLNSAEIYNSGTGNWTLTNSLAVGRSGATATMMPNGRTLIVGGNTTSGVTAAVEMYDLLGGTWSATGSMANQRAGQTATPLPNGNVLVAGGFLTNPSAPVAVTSAELYNSTTGTWSSTTAMHQPRFYHTATLLPDGQVLVVGGKTNNSIYSLATAELYNPATATWTFTGSMSTQRDSHTATLLPNGRVLVAGGGGVSGYQSSAEIYDPASGMWSATGSMSNVHYAATANLLTNGEVLVAGGVNASGQITNRCDLYYPATGAWSNAATLNTSRRWHTASLLPNGNVLVTGGSDGAANLGTCEVYNPISNLWSFTGPLITARVSHRAATLVDGKILVAGGYNAVPFTNSEVYDSATGVWTATGPAVDVCSDCSITPLLNGKLLMTGGWTGAGESFSFLTNAEIYDPGLGYTAATQPEINTIPSPFILGGSFEVTGSDLRGFSQTDDNPDAASSSDFPIVRLRSFENEQNLFLTPTRWSTNVFASTTVTNFPLGWATTTVFANGIPSSSFATLVSATAPGALTATLLGNGETKVSFTGTPGVSYSVLGTTNLGLRLTNWYVAGGATDSVATPGGIPIHRPRLDYYSAAVLPGALAVGLHVGPSRCFYVGLRCRFSLPGRTPSLPRPPDVRKGKSSCEGEPRSRQGHVGCCQGNLPPGGFRVIQRCPRIMR